RTRFLTPTCCRSAARIRAPWCSPPHTTGNGRQEKGSPAFAGRPGFAFARTAWVRAGSELRLVVAGLVALHRVDHDRACLGRVAPAVELDPLAVFQVLVVLEEVA